jgi:hypothetical protein
MIHDVRATRRNRKRLIEIKADSQMIGHSAVSAVHDQPYGLVVSPPSAAIAMNPGSQDREPSPEELLERIHKSLLLLFRTLSAVNTDVSLYHHGIRNNRSYISAWHKLDEAYSMYEEQANNGRRLWMKLRAWSEKEHPLMDAAGGSFLPVEKAPVRSPSPLEYQSDAGEDQQAATTSGHEVTPMDIDLPGPQHDIPRPSIPVVDPPPPKPTSKVRLHLQCIPCVFLIRFSRRATLRVCEV